MEMIPELWLGGSALLLGLVFGAAAQRSRFCVVSAVSNLALMRDYRQLHAYLAALAVALAGTTVLEWGQWVDIAQSGYRRPVLSWAGALGGGLVFGLGAMLAGGCASRTLVRSAEGNIGSLVALVAFALTGMATLFGVLEPVRGWIDRQFGVYIGGGDASLSLLLGLPLWAAPLALVLVSLVVIFAVGGWREHRGLVAAGGLIGLTVVGGWWATGWLGQDEFAPTAPSSLNMAAPLARDALYLATGQVTGSLFALLLIPGVLLGALASALMSGEFRWIPPEGSRVGSYMVGGALMGIGAVFAGGCNIGQGLTGLATASVSSLVAVAGIVVGMWIGLKLLQR